MCVCAPKDATVYVGGLDEKVSEPLLWELFLQAGPVVNTHMPKDRVTGQHQGMTTWHDAVVFSKDQSNLCLFFSLQGMDLWSFSVKKMPIML